MHDPISAYQAALDTVQPERACMVISDLCGSTSIAFANVHVGSALQAAHEALCAEVSGLSIDAPAFKAMGDGVMIEVPDPVQASQVALAIADRAGQLRKKAEARSVDPAFQQFVVKLVVAAGEFRRAPGSQRWLGMLPTKASRIAAFARDGEVWVDNEVALAIRPYLSSDLAAECDPDPGNGAAFYVPLKGLDNARISVHLLRRKGQDVALETDELKKAWKIPWSYVMTELKRVSGKIAESGFNPDQVVGIGRSGAILGGIVAGNLGHLPIETVERRHDDPRRILSTLTEPDEIYNGDVRDPGALDPRPAWKARRVLLVMGEAKSAQSFFAAREWLRVRGVDDVRTLAFLKTPIAPADWWCLEAPNAWMPWQFKAGYDAGWPTYAS